MAGKLKRFFCIFLALALLSGCQRQQNEDEGSGRFLETDERLKVVTTIFPYYDFVRQIAGDKVKRTLVVPAGMDSHSFEPTPADMITIQEADVLICNGGEMEHWVEQVLSSLDTSSMKVLTMMDYVDVVEEEHVEGMEEGGHDHEHEEASEQAVFDADDGHENHIEYDEHIWTSPVNAIAITELIADTLKECSPVNASYFEENEERYRAELKKLDSDFRQVVSEGRTRMIVVADRFPFRYFADEYGLSYRAAFSGCSGDTEPSAKTIAYLIDRIRENQIPAVYYLELSSHRTADIIEEETGAKPLLLHSCHNVTRRQFDEGITYLQLMEKNVEHLRQGLR